MKNSDFKKEWSDEDFKNAKKAITQHFGGKRFRTHHEHKQFFPKRFEDIDNILGFAYTSSGIYAWYGICNTQVYPPTMPGLHYEAVVIANDGTVYAELWDKDENETHIKL